MHGTNGEDGTIQGYLEMLKIPYAGCDVIGAAVGQDKVVMKHILQNSGLPVCPWFWLYGHEFAHKQEAVLAQVHELGYPVVMKPACLRIMMKNSSPGSKTLDNMITRSLSNRW